MGDRSRHRARCHGARPPRTPTRRGRRDRREQRERDPRLLAPLAHAVGARRRARPDRPTRPPRRRSARTVVSSIRVSSISRRVPCSAASLLRRALGRAEQHARHAHVLEATEPASRSRPDRRRPPLPRPPRSPPPRPGRASSRAPRALRATSSRASERPRQPQPMIRQRATTGCASRASWAGGPSGPAHRRCCRTLAQHPGLDLARRVTSGLPPGPPALVVRAPASGRGPRPRAPRAARQLAGRPEPTCSSPEPG